MKVSRAFPEELLAEARSITVEVDGRKYTIVDRGGGHLDIYARGPVAVWPVADRRVRVVPRYGAETEEGGQP